MSADQSLLSLDPRLEEQLNDIDEYIRAQNSEHVNEQYLPRRYISARNADLLTDRAVPDQAMPTDFEEAENYPDEQTLHGEFLDSSNLRSSWIHRPFESSLTPPGLDFEVHFWNLKDIYEKKPRKTPDGFGYRLEDSTVTIEATTSSELHNLQVYVQRCPEAAIKTHDTAGPMELEVTVKHHNQNQTIITVELDSVYNNNTDREDALYWLEKAEVETRNKWELLVVPRFTNGTKGAVRSKPFRITSKARVKPRKNRDAGLMHKNPRAQQRRQCAFLDGFDAKECIYPSPPYGEEPNLKNNQEGLMKSSSAEQAATQLQLELAMLQMREDPMSPLSPPWTPTPLFPESLSVGRVILKPKTPLDRELITSRYNHDSRIECAMEQSDLPGLMKMVSKKGGAMAGRRRANGHKSAEENFWWACGFCFFERRKKSTVKAHVMQRVCRKSCQQKGHKNQWSRGRMKRYSSCDAFLDESFDAFSWKNSLSV